MFRRMSLNGKLTLLMLTASAVALAVATFAFVWNDLTMFRTAKVRQMRAIAELLAANSTAAISFEQSVSAAELLTALRNSPTVVYACLQLPDGRIFAEHAPSGRRTRAIWNEEGERFTPDGALELRLPILEGTERLGWIYLRATQDDLAQQTLVYAQIVLLVVTVAFCVSLLLSTRLQRLISAPIQRLATAAQRISDDGDYSIRMERRSEDEIGLLYQQFNGMLDRIQDVDTALRQAHSELEARVRQRTAQLSQTNELLRHEMLERERVHDELRRKEERFRAIVDNASDGIVTFGDDDTIDAFNPAAESIFGCVGEAVSGKHVNCLVAQQDRSRIEPWLRDDADAAPGVRRIELEGRRASGVQFLMELTCTTSRLGEERLHTLFVRDLTEKREAEQQLSELNRQLLVASRQAGMAEVANSVLHNIGNVLNSVNVSAGLVLDKTRTMRIEGLQKVVGLFQSHPTDLGDFLTRDEKGRMLPGYLERLADHFSDERDEVMSEIVSLVSNIEHIKDIVRSQQSYAGVVGVVEACDLANLLDDALRFAQGGIERRGIEVVREYDPLPLVDVDRSKLLQILVNLIRNALDALESAPVKSLTLRLLGREDGTWVQVSDTGVGIAKEHLTAIFSHGFTTKRHGHGFGLHASANAANELGGSLSVQSDGPGTGATFTVRIPSRTVTAINAVSV